MGRLYKRGQVWYIDYSVFGKRQRERIGTNKKLAENILKKRELEIVENRYLDIKKEEKIKFPDFAKEYLEYYSKPNKKSWHSDVDTINILNRFFNLLYLYEITPLLVEKFKTERIKEVSPATVNRNLACLKCLFNRAIEWGKTQNNPVRKIKLFRENNRRLRYLELDEIDNLLNNSSSYLKPIIILALNTGMRKGEILGLKWPDLDFKQNLIYLLNTKSGEKREIPMNEQVRTALIKARKHPQRF
jgi:integrase